MPEASYWYVAVGPLSVPYWPEIAMYETEVGGERGRTYALYYARER